MTALFQCSLKVGQARGRVRRDSEIFWKTKKRERWDRAGVSEFARLAQGLGETKGMDVIKFIARAEIPFGKKFTYARYVVDYRPEKDEPWRLRITCGGDRLECNGETSSPCVDACRLDQNVVSNHIQPQKNGGR